MPDLTPFNFFPDIILWPFTKLARFFSGYFSSDRKMRELNKQFRGKNYATDVLSFPFEEPSDSTANQSDFLGDIAISVETATRQAIENNLSFETEIKQLILHGILHLSGYDHETDHGEMNARELELREILKI